MSIGLQQQPKTSGDCPGGGAKEQHTVLLSACHLHGGESLNVIYS